MALAASPAPIEINDEQHALIVRRLTEPATIGSSIEPFDVFTIEEGPKKNPWYDDITK